MLTPFHCQVRGLHGEGVHPGLHTLCRFDGKGYAAILWLRFQGGTLVETIRLTGVGGIDQLCGVDQYAQHWFEFWADTDLPDRGDVRCAVCGKEIANGWCCTRNGEFLCHEHILY